VPGGREVVAVTYHEGEAAGEPRHARPIESASKRYGALA